MFSRTNRNREAVASLAAICKYVENEKPVSIRGPSRLAYTVTQNGRRPAVYRYQHRIQESALRIKNHARNPVAAGRNALESVYRIRHYSGTLRPVATALFKVIEFSFRAQKQNLPVRTEIR